MANTAIIDRKTSALILSSLAAPFVAIARFLVHLAEISPQMRALSRLQRISDAQLEARGLTREGEIRRIVGVSGL